MYILEKWQNLVSQRQKAMQSYTPPYSQPVRVDLVKGQLVSTSLNPFFFLDQMLFLIGSKTGYNGTTIIISSSQICLPPYFDYFWKNGRTSFHNDLIKPCKVTLRHILSQ